jgi:hypothetical protein
MIPDRHLSSKNRFSVEGVCIVIVYPRNDADTYLAVLEVVKQDIEALALDTIISHHYARASDDLARVALPVDLAQPSPSAENFGVSDLDQVNFVLGAEGFNELDVLRLRAGLDEDAQVGLAFVQGFGAFTETTSETVMDQCVFKYLL